MMNNLSCLNRKIGTRLIDSVEGYIVCESDNYSMINNLNDNMLDGFSLIRKDTIYSVNVSLSSNFVRRLLMLKGCVAADFIDCPIQTPQSAMEWLMSERLVCGIHMESGEEVFSFFGYIVKVDIDKFLLHELSVNGIKYDEPTEYDLSECTKIDFLGEYERGLTLYDIDRC